MTVGRKSKAVGRERLAEYAAEITGIASEDCYKVINAALEGLAIELTQGHRVELRGLGGFRFHTHKGRLRGGLPAMSDVVFETPMHAVVRFYPSKKIKDQIAKLRFTSEDGPKWRLYRKR